MTAINITVFIVSHVLLFALFLPQENAQRSTMAKLMFVASFSGVIWCWSTIALWVLK